MTLKQELASWNPFNSSDVKPGPVPSKGDRAPSTDKLEFPRLDGKPTMISFLRHCGCPFAEKTFINLRALAGSNPSISFIAVSHSDESSTQQWLESVGGRGNVDVIVDHERKIYGAWGLGPSGFLHVLSPSALMGTYNVGKEDGIWNKPTQSGSRWQTAGSFAVNGDGEVVWGRPSKQADDIPSLDEGLSAAKRG